MSYLLESEITLPRPLDEVFDFFSNAENLERITPSHLSFHIQNPTPIEMRPGTRIDYRLRVRGLPMRWRSEITAWEPPHRFVDEQLRGPYRKWVHEHTFEAADGGRATLCGDRVEYEVPGGPFAPLVHALFVRRDVEGIFAYRSKVLRELFE